MSRTQTIVRFVTFLPADNEHGHQEMLRAGERITKRGFTLVRNASYMLAAKGLDSGEGATSHTHLLDVFPGTAASTRLKASSCAQSRSTEELHRVAEASAQCYNLLETSDTHFRLESDALGLKPAYIARTEAGHVMASRVADILALFPALAQPADRVAIHELMTFWTPLSGRTIHQHIKRTMPGGRYSWTPTEGLSAQRWRGLQPPTIEATRHLDELTAALRDATLDSLRNKAEGAKQPITLALSGGYDSRYVAALCRDLDMDTRAFTHGRHHHKEIRSARAIARALDLNLDIRPLAKNTTLDSMDDHLDILEGMVDPSALSIMNLRSRDDSVGASLLDGFAGDLLTGHQFSSYCAADFASRETLADALVRHYHHNTHPNLHEVLTPAPDLQQVYQDVLDGLRQDCPPHQAYLLWYAENRNRRYVAARFAMMGKYTDTILPFYDRTLFDLWHAIPPIGLRDQTVFRQLMARHYPKLARIPHPDNPAPIIPNLRVQLANFGLTLPARILSRFIGKERARTIASRLYLDDDIYTVTKLCSPQQRRHMLNQLALYESQIEATLDIRLSTEYVAILADNTQALRSLFSTAYHTAHANNTRSCPYQPR